MNKETLKAIPFDALEVLNTETGESTYDRVSYADDIARYFSSFTTNGIVVLGGNVLGDQFKVTHTTGLKVSVATGSAVIDGRVCWRDEVGEDLTLDIGEPDPRIDRIVLELNKLKDDRAVYLKVLKGTAAAVPVAPALTRTTDVYQLSLAQVLVEANQAIIAAVTDERPDETVCGLANVTLGIKPPTGMDAETVKLSTRTYERYGIQPAYANVDEALFRNVDKSAYFEFVKKVNADSLDAAFGKYNEDLMTNIGLQLALYGVYANYTSGVRISDYPNLIRCSTIADINNNLDAILELFSISSLIEMSPFAIEKFNWNSVFAKEGLVEKLKGDSSAMDKVLSSVPLTDKLYADLSARAMLYSNKQVLGGYTDYSEFVVPAGVNALTVAIVGAGGDGSNGVSNAAGAGGKGGEYKHFTLSVTPGQIIPWFIKTTGTSFAGISVGKGGGADANTTPVQSGKILPIATHGIFGGSGSATPAGTGGDALGVFANTGGAAGAGGSFGNGYPGENGAGGSGGGGNTGYSNASGGGGGGFGGGTGGKGTTRSDVSSGWGGGGFGGGGGGGQGGNTAGTGGKGGAGIIVVFKN